MKVDSNRLINGIIQYAENEVINNLPTTGKWLLGAGVGIAASRLEYIVNALNENALAKAMGIVDDDGMFDVDLMMNNLKRSANRYGKMTVDVPIVGKLTFNESDVDDLHRYIEM